MDYLEVLVKKIDLNPKYKEYTGIFSEYINDEFGDEIDWDDVRSDLNSNDDCALYEPTNNDFLMYIIHLIDDIIKKDGWSNEYNNVILCDDIKHDIHLTQSVHIHNTPESVNPENITEEINKKDYNIENPLVIISCQYKKDADLVSKMFRDKYGYYVVTYPENTSNNSNKISKKGFNNFLKNCAEYYKGIQGLFDSVIIIMDIPGKFNTDTIIKMFEDPVKPTVLFKDTYLLENDPNRDITNKPCNAAVFENVHKLDITKYNSMPWLSYFNNNNTYYSGGICLKTLASKIACDSMKINIPTIYCNIYFIINKDNIIKALNDRVMMLEKQNIELARKLNQRNPHHFINQTYFMKIQCEYPKKTN